MQPFYTAEITINATPERVWDALTNPDITQQYMFGCRSVSDWKPGSRLDWVGTHEGKDVTYVTGKIVTFQPYERFVYTVIDPMAKYELTPENHLTVDCTLKQLGNSTHVLVTQGDYTKVAEGEKRYGHGNGWVGVLNAIKDLLEK
ncbi:MAG: SRPBCC domain-containing protein [Taibaiella sp.]|nr:SRPBCC domain-containing protein [Taibaiella sp.]